MVRGGCAEAGGKGEGWGGLWEIESGIKRIKYHLFSCVLCHSFHLRGFYSEITSVNVLYIS